MATETTFYEMFTEYMPRFSHFSTPTPENLLTLVIL